MFLRSIMCTSIQQLILRKQEYALLCDAFVRFSNFLLYFRIDFLHFIQWCHNVSKFWQVFVNFALGVALSDDDDPIDISILKIIYFFLAPSISFLRSSSLSSLNFFGLVFLSPSILKCRKK